MRCLVKNKRTFWYALYKGKEITQDASGRRTGYKAVYGNPVKASANVSASKGDATAQYFGSSLDYDKTLCYMSLPIDEYSLLWIGAAPSLADDGSLALDAQGNPATPHDYRVAAIGESLNGTLAAIKKVQRNG